jgi:hypothetical protein
VIVLLIGNGTISRECLARVAYLQQSCRACCDLATALPDYSYNHFGIVAILQRLTDKAQSVVELSTIILGSPVSGAIRGNPPHNPTHRKTLANKGKKKVFLNVAYFG